MKKVMILILHLALITSLCACHHADSPDSIDQITQAPIIAPSDNTENAPDQNLIQEDLEKALLEHNQYASITSIETVKSLTKEGTFLITLSLTAETKYADWTYEAEMNYTKYDQGWIVDNVNLSSGEYILVRLPDEDAIIDLVNSMDAPTYDYDKITPVESGVLNVSDTLETEELNFSWSVIHKKMHAEECEDITMRLKYSAEDDTWRYIPFTEDMEFLRSITIKPYDVDLSGFWDSQYAYGITIENFTWDGFDLHTTSFQTGTINTHFHKISGNPNSNVPSFGWYSDGEGYYCEFSFGVDGTTFKLYSFGGRTDVTLHEYLKISNTANP
jgi:hypothetical protein